MVPHILEENHCRISNKSKFIFSYKFYLEIIIFILKDIKHMAQLAYLKYIYIPSDPATSLV